MGWIFNPFTGKLDNKGGGGGGGATLEKLRLSGKAGFGSTNTKLAYWTTETTNTLSTLATLTNNSTDGGIITASANCMVFGTFFSSYSNSSNIFSVRNAADYTASPTTESQEKVVNNKSANGFADAHLHTDCVLESGDELAFYASSTSTYIDAEWELVLYFVSI